MKTQIVCPPGCDLREVFRRIGGERDFICFSNRHSSQRNLIWKRMNLFTPQLLIRGRLFKGFKGVSPTHMVPYRGNLYYTPQQVFVGDRERDDLYQDTPNKFPHFLGERKI